MPTVQNQALPGECDLRPRPKEALLHAQRTLPPSPGYAWPSPPSVVPHSRADLAPEISRAFRVSRTFPSSPCAPGLSLFGLVPVRAAQVVVCSSRCSSASDAGAARAARADRSSSTAPLSSRLLGPVAESPYLPLTLFPVLTARPRQGAGPGLPENQYVGVRD